MPSLNATNLCCDSTIQAHEGRSATKTWHSYYLETGMAIHSSTCFWIMPTLKVYQIMIGKLRNFWRKHEDLFGKRTFFLEQENNVFLGETKDFYAEWIKKKKS